MANFREMECTKMTISFATCDLCDANKRDFPRSFRVLPPVFHDFGAIKKFCGPVETVKCFEDNSLVKVAVESQGWIETRSDIDGSVTRIAKVLVVDGGASLRYALLGGNLGLAAARNGWAGVVINGCVRDVTELAQHPVGIRALGAIPLPTEKRNEGQHNVTVQVQGVVLVPGDWLYADEDGIVVASGPLL